MSGRCSETRFEELVEELRMLAERKLKEELSKRSSLELFLFKLFTPLEISLITDKGNATIVVEGSCVRAELGASSFPDLVVRTRLKTLEELLSTRSAEDLLEAERRGELRLVALTQKGKGVEAKLMELFGRS